MRQAQAGMGEADSPLDLWQRGDARKILREVRITGGPGALVADVFEFTGAVWIKSQIARITSVTTLVNATNVYADVDDGAAQVDLTKQDPGGAVLSGMEVGTAFLKDEVETQPYSVIRADQVRAHFPSGARTFGEPFWINAKPGATNVMRLHLTTTDAPVDFNVLLRFEYLLFDGSTFEILLPEV